MGCYLLEVTFILFWNHISDTIKPEQNWFPYSIQISQLIWLNILFTDARTRNARNGWWHTNRFSWNRSNREPKVIKSSLVRQCFFYEHIFLFWLALIVSLLAVTLAFVNCTAYLWVSRKVCIMKKAFVAYLSEVTWLSNVMLTVLNIIKSK